MFITQKIYTNINIGCTYVLLLILLYCIPSASFAQVTDSSAITLKKVMVTGKQRPVSFKNIIPAQILTNTTLTQLNAYSVGDAARYFSGVLIRDYGGIGGLKTISVRSLGAANTGIIYDGIPVSDVQSGQVDLSRFSGTFVQSIELFQANPPGLLLPARSFGSSSILAISTNAFNTGNFSKSMWQAGMKAGSFGLIEPSAAIYLPAGKNSIISANVESVFSKGNYPFYIDNGSYSSKAVRNNSDIQSFQGEINFVKQFSDSSTWQTKIWSYTSERGLPGAVIFFNDRSVQKLWNTDVFVQSRYHKQFNKTLAFLVSAKYGHTYTRYTDPDFLNNQGGLDDRYTQQEIYLSGALRKKLTEHFQVSIASDAATSKLIANTPGFAFPSRFSLWNSLSSEYAFSHWQLTGSLLHTYISDETKTGSSTADKDKLTPTFAVSFKPAPTSPYIFRFFYKDVFRMPTFNDLYYNFIGNNNLRPEYSQQYNLGASYSKNFTGKVRQLNMSADAYFNTIKDKIIAVPNKNLFVWTMLNLGEVHVKGLDITTEATGTFSKDFGWFTRVAYTHQQALDVTNRASSSYKNRIPYTPDNSGSGIANLTYKNWGGGYNILFSGIRYTLGENSAFSHLPGWATHDLFISCFFTNKHFTTTIKAELNNVTNKYYDVVKYFPMPGRSFKIGMTIHNL